MMKFKGVELWLAGDAERQEPTEVVAQDLQLTKLTIADISSAVSEALRGHMGAHLRQLIVVMVVDDYKPGVPFLPDARFDIFEANPLSDQTIAHGITVLEAFLNNRAPGE